MLEVTEEGEAGSQAVRQVEVSNNVHCGKPPLDRRRNSCLDRANLLSVQHHLRPSSGRPPSYFRAEGELDFRFAAFSLISDWNRTFLLRTATPGIAQGLRSSWIYSGLILRTNPTGE